MQLDKALLLVALSAITMCCAAAEPDKAEASSAPSQILVLNMRISNGQHEVTDARIVDTHVPLKEHVVPGVAVVYAVTDASDVALSVGTFDDPRILRGPMASPGDGTPGHATVVRDSAEYVLRVRYSKSMRYLKFLSALPANAGTREKI